MRVRQVFALVIEICVAAGRHNAALSVLARMERMGLQPDRRIYAALIRSFGNINDVPRSALQLASQPAIDDSMSLYFSDYFFLPVSISLCYSSASAVLCCALLCSALLGLLLQCDGSFSRNETKVHPRYAIPCHPML